MRFLGFEELQCCSGIRTWMFLCRISVRHVQFTEVLLDLGCTAAHVLSTLTENGFVTCPTAVLVLTLRMLQQLVVVESTWRGAHVGV
jgi:hypothetical protein